MNSSDTLEWLGNGCVVPLEAGPASRSAEPNSVWIGWGAPRRATSPEAGRLSVYAPDFFLRDPEPWRVFPCSSQVPVGALREQLEAEIDDLAPEPYSWTPPELETFERLFTDLQRRISLGELKKAVPAVFASASGAFTQSRLAHTLKSALDASIASPLNVYGLWNADGGILGATPELLFRCTGPRSITTAAVAGTRPHAARADARLPLMEDPKEIEEHQFVIDGIREGFAGMGTVRVAATQELRLAGFSHLFAPVEVCFDRAEPFDAIVRALHPTPAVGGWPREAGMQWLEWMEREDERRGVGGRERFGAPFGAFMGGDAERAGICWVAIRCMQWNHDAGATALRLAAGCGVTAQSELQREWHELRIKLQAIRAALAV